MRRPNLYMVMLGANNASDADMSMLAEAETEGRLRRMSIGRGVLRVETAATSLIAAARTSAHA